jgi:peptidoglycan/xylan/chitin deacetylase (PgdA/CDA1 family)
VRCRRSLMVVITRRRLLAGVLGLVLAAALIWSPDALAVAGHGLRLVASEAQLQPIRRGPATAQRMSLMVNVDWGDEFIPGMLETFARYGVLATWFPTGRWATRAPELTREIAAAGHELGNHGGWHGMASQMGTTEVRRLISEGEVAIHRASGQRPRIFAPPAGDVNERAVAVANELGYKTVLWTIDTIDWQRPAPSVIIERVVSRAQPGALVLMHPTKPTAEALPAILEQLLSLGYELVTVSQLLGE